MATLISICQSSGAEIIEDINHTAIQKRQPAETGLKRSKYTGTATRISSNITNTFVSFLTFKLI